MEILSAVVAEVTIAIGKYVCGKINHQISYLSNYKSNVENVEVQLKQLKWVRQNVQMLLDESQIKHEHLTTELDWMKTVDDIDKNITELINQANNLHNKLIEGGRSVCYLQYHFGREATKKMRKLEELHGHGQTIVAKHQLNPGIESPGVKGFEEFESTMSAMMDIIKALRDPNNSIIGVVGMGGVGKTTLVTELGRRLRTEGCYRHVVIVDMTQNPDIMTIQGQIARNFGLNLADDNINARAATLSKKVKEKKKALIILDNLWHKAKLDLVGIPHGDEHEGCKVLVVSRNEDVCRVMKCQLNIHVKVLSNSDSLKLFNRAADIENSDTFKSVAKVIAEKCGGLPMVIITLGSALRGQDDMRIWDDVVAQLTNSIPTATIEGMETDVFLSLSASYSSLRSRELQLFFLFCCLFPEGCNISTNKLMQYGVADEFIKDVGALKEARNRTCAFARKLRACCLLLNGNQKKFKLHEVIRKVGIQIAEKEHQFLAISNLPLNKTKLETSNNLKRISLINSKIESLDGWPEQPDLLTLLLQKNYSLAKISNNFFEGMRKLRVLDLSGTSISRLPDSITCLVSLRTLCLNNCYELVDVSVLGSLRMLQILSLRKSGIKELTEKIGQLNNLMLLDLRNTFKLKNVAPNVILGLSCLEELYMAKSFGQWDDEGKASFAELGSLSRLNVLHIGIKNIGCLSRNLSNLWSGLKQFCVHVGTEFVTGNEEQCQKTLTMRRVESIHHLGGSLLEETENLSLMSCNVTEVENLNGFFFESVPATFIGQLRFLKISDCKKIKTILPSDILQKLPQLESVDIDRCDDVQVIFQCEGLARGKNILSSLRKLNLSFLQKLTAIWDKATEDVSIDLRMLEELEVSGSQVLRFVFGPHIAQRLEKLKRLILLNCHRIEKLVSDEQGWLIPSTHQSSTTFQNLIELEIVVNSVLKSLFPLSLARELLHLEKIKLFQCDEMMAIISTESNDAVDQGIFPKLRILSLELLPKLTSFYNGNVLLDWPSLEHIVADACPNLKKLPIGLQGAPKLKKIEGDKIWFERLQWAEDGVKSRLQLFLGEYKRPPQQIRSSVH